VVLEVNISQVGLLFYPVHQITHEKLLYQPSRSQPLRRWLGTQPAPPHPSKLARTSATALEEHVLKQFIAVLSITLATAAMADEGQSCYAAAAEKKLYGSAKTSFLTKCKKDARAKCEAASKEKNLSGAAMSSFETKCVKDAVGEVKPAS
jgi:hypothetical protein